jgi:hypothetical protein
MKKKLCFIFIVVISFTSCNLEESEPIDPWRDQNFLLGDRQILCVGQTAQLKIYSTVLQREVPIKDVTFEIQPSDMGSVSPSGLFTPNNNIQQSTEVNIKAKFNKPSMGNIFAAKIRVQPSSSNPKLGVQTADNELKGGRNYSRLPSDEVIFGSEFVATFGGSNQNFNYEVVKASGEGKIIWKKQFGMGNARLVKSVDDMVFLAGHRYVAGSAFSVPQIMIIDPEGNILKEILFEDGEIEAFDVDKDKNMYLSMRIWSEHNSFRRIKVSEGGEIIFDIKSNYELISLKITEEKEMIGLCRLLDNPDNEGLIFFDKEGNEVWQKSTGRRATESILFIRPSSDIGLAFSKYDQLLESSVWYTEIVDQNGQIKESNTLALGIPNPGTLFFPTQPKYQLNSISDVLVADRGEVFLMGTGTDDNTDYIVVASKEIGGVWIWWYKNETPIKGANLLALYETEGSLKLMADTRPELRIFSLGKYNLDFDQCSYNPLWSENNF